MVGNDVWFGYGATVMPGVRIGDGALVAAEAVVVEDVPAYGIVGGNPSKLIRKRFAEDEIARLLGVAWWDWAPEKVGRHIPAIMARSVGELEAAE
ncbi:hypothetical protein [Kribbella sp. NPDC051718]|uniref:hypothetical protein n=1 Tax=Kribbella sp. NPDC051718 TaxID=3155168 RepID=UPI003443476E